MSISPLTQLSSSSRPSSTSTSVQAIRIGLGPRLPLSNLHTHLLNVCDALTEVSTHISSAIPLYSEIHQALRTATRLTDTTASLITFFHRACTTTLEDLDLFPQLLSDGLLPAIENLAQSRIETSKKLAKTCENLACQFDLAGANIANILTNALSHKLQNEQKRTQLTSKASELSQNLQQRRTAAYHTVRAAEDALQNYNQALKRENTAMKVATVGRAAQAGAVVASILATRTVLLATAAGAGANAFITSADMERNRAREERAVQLRRFDSLRKETAERESEIAALTEILRGLHIEKGTHDNLFVSLIKCISALDQLAAAMILAQTLWTTVADGVADDGSLELLKQVNSLKEDELKDDVIITRLEKHWKQMQTWWVAMLDICTDAVTEVKLVQQTHVRNWRNLSQWTVPTIEGLATEERLQLENEDLDQVLRVTNSSEDNVEIEHMTD